ncbi:MAG: helix-turn-helix domain-containing protein [Kiloniellales bacterium]|nr:helix-turn-helix domain-containing protein [Kiloniellales bacterium]
MSNSEARRPLVCLLASAETSPSVLYGLYDVLSTAGAMYGELTSGKTGDEVLDVKIVAASAKPFRCFGNVMVEPHLGIDAVDEPDFVIVCDMYTPIDKPPRGLYGREIDWLRRMYTSGSRLGSVCSGSLVLAEAGLIDGEEASGHWAYRDLFREHYPKVKLRLGEILSFAGEGDRIVTAGGVTSWQELALYVIALLGGAEHAIQAAKIHILSGHSEGQMPYAVVTHRVQHSDAVIADCQSWIAEHFCCDNPVARMTERSGLNPRTFARRFRAATGYLPMEYVQALRIEEAKKLLEANFANVEEIGQMVGYEDPTFFRRLFKRRVGLTPAAYRKKFTKIAAAAFGRAA